MRRLFVLATLLFALPAMAGPTSPPGPTPTPTPAPCPTVVTTLEVSSGVIEQLGATTDIAVTTSAALTVGSTDVKVNFDPSQLQAVDASSSTLSSFTFFIDNEAGTVTTASASFPSDALAAGDPLFTVTFTTADGATLGSVTTIFLSDADGVGCKDLAGPVPPIPPVSLPYSQVPGEVDIGVLGDVDCDGSLTPIDASVVLGLFVGNISDGDLPPPCDDPAHRLAISDWALDGVLTPIDASITLGVFVGAIDPLCDTPLGIALGNCPTAAAMQRSAAPNTALSAALRKAKSWASRAWTRRGKAVTTALSKAKLRVGREWARRGQEVTVDVTTRRELEVGSTGLSLSYDAGALEVVVVESELEGFMYQVDEAASVIRTASAGLGQELAAGDALMSVVFRVKPDAKRGRHRVSVSGELGGPVLDGKIPEPIEPVARSGFVRVRRR